MISSFRSHLNLKRRRKSIRRWPFSLDVSRTTSSSTTLAKLRFRMSPKRCSTARWTLIPLFFLKVPRQCASSSSKKEWCRLCQMTRSKKLSELGMVLDKLLYSINLQELFQLRHVNIAVSGRSIETPSEKQLKKLLFNNMNKTKNLWRMFDFSAVSAMITKTLLLEHLSLRNM